MTARPAASTGDARHDEHDDGASALHLRRRGIVLLIGAAVIVALVQPIGPLAYAWNPLLAGLAFTAAAAVTGPRSPLWGAGLVVAFWGLSQVVAAPLGLPGAAFSTAMIGGGGLVAAYLGSRGFAVSPASVAAPVVFIGLGQYLHSTFRGAEITLYTAGLAAAWGIVELLSSLRTGRAGPPA